MTKKNNPHAEGAGEVVGMTTHRIPLAPSEGPMFDATEAHDDPDTRFLDMAERAIAQLAAAGVEFTTDDIRELGVPEPDRPTMWGSAIKAAQKAGIIERIAATNSRRPIRHGGLHHVWRGIQGTEGVAE